MLQEIRIEVPSELEAIDYCKENGYTFIKVYQGRGTNSGKLMLLAYGEFDKPIQTQKQTKVDPDEKPRFIVYCTANFGAGLRTMYVADPKKSDYRTTFIEGEAKLFTERQALGTSAGMNRRGKYNWKIRKIK